MRVLKILLVIPATSASVKRSNSAWRYIKKYIQEQYEWALILMYVHRYIKLDYNKTIDFFANNHPRRMHLILPGETE